MTEDKPEEGSHLRSLARSHREARSHRQSSIASPKLERIAVLPSPSLPILESLVYGPTELSFRKKCCIGTFPLVFGIPQQSSIVILGVTFKEDSRFTIHVYEKLKKANRCLFIIRSLRKEGYRRGGNRSFIHYASFTEHYICSFSIWCF